MLRQRQRVRSSPVSQSHGRLAAMRLSGGCCSSRRLHPKYARSGTRQLQAAWCSRAWHATGVAASWGMWAAGRTARRLWRRCCLGGQRLALSLAVTSIYRADPQKTQQQQERVCGNGDIWAVVVAGDRQVAKRCMHAPCLGKRNPDRYEHGDEPGQASSHTRSLLLLQYLEPLIVGLL